MGGKARLLRDDELRRLLVGRHVRVTDQRMALLRALSEARAPSSHAELTRQLTDGGRLDSKAGLDRATIYRNLLSLTKLGILIRTQLGDNVWRFELPLSKGGDHHEAHPHFVCSNCGDITCLPEGAVRLLGPAKLKEVAEVQLRGRCETCVG